MRFYTGQHTYFCGVDLHTKTMLLCILDQRSDIVLQRNAFATPKSFLAAIEPFRDGTGRCRGMHVHLALARRRL